MIAFFVLQENMSSLYKILIVQIVFFLQIYADCLEMNSLLEIDQVCVLVKDAYGILSKQIQESTIKQEQMILDKLGGKMELI